MSEPKYYLKYHQYHDDDPTFVNEYPLEHSNRAVWYTKTPTTPPLLLTLAQIESIKQSYLTTTSKHFKILNPDFTPYSPEELKKEEKKEPVTLPAYNETEPIQLWVVQMDNITVRSWTTNTDGTELVSWKCTYDAGKYYFEDREDAVAICNAINKTRQPSWSKFTVRPKKIHLPKTTYLVSTLNTLLSSMQTALATCNQTSV